MDEKASKGLQVIGTGLPRTGSSSLKAALEILGYGPCHHFKSDVVEERFPYPNSKLWATACKTEDSKERQRILHQIYTDGGHKSGTDYPTSCFVEDLVEMYPDAKFVHCERSSAQLWRKSLNETIGRTQQAMFSLPAMLLPVFALSLRPVLTQLNARVKRTLAAPLYGPSTEVGLYYAHNEHVRKVVPKDKLLIFDPKDGFRPLCEFLGVPVPKDDQGRELDYPHMNDREAITKTMNRFVFVAWLLWGASFVGLYFAVRRWVDLRHTIKF